MKYIDSVARVKLTGAKLIRADELVRAQHDRELAEGETPDFTTCMIALVRAVPDEFTQDEVPAIVFRMHALSALLKSADLKGWAQKVQAEPGLWFVNEALLEAAATGKLELAGDEPSFDPDEFKALALKAAESEGSA